jgi:hypothetical protein
MWNADIEQRYRSDVNTAYSNAYQNFSAVRDRTPAAVLNLPGAVDQVNRAKQIIEQSVHTLQQRTNDIATAITSLVNSKTNIRQDINTKKQETQRLKQEVEKARELNALRKEQAAELKIKYGSNYHTSYLGLWRPLADQSQMGLIVASVMFALIAIVSLVFVIREFYSAPASQYSARNLFGGVRIRK